MFVAWNRQRSWISLWKRLQRLRTSLRALRTALRPRIRPLRVVQAAGKPSHQSTQAAHAQTRTRRKRPRGTFGTQISRPRRVARAIGGRTRRRQGQSTTAPSRRKRRFRDGRSPPRAFLLAARVAVGTRRHRPLALAIGKRRQRSSLLCFIASVCRFRAAFFSGPGSISVSLRHSAYKAHITSKHSLASKTAAQRIKADICGSALPPSRKEEKQ